ncbi:amino acid transporter [Marmoricola sp. OAE513]|uniref:APC family permease n=1 Tax=Marmoricola sp. OAE513 TaxID=2817894 RepID=UPI001AE98B3E
MHDAISRALHDRPESEGLGTTPALEGLRRRSLASADVLAPSLAATKPAATALVVPVVVTAFVGPGAWLSVVLAVLAALLLRRVIDEFTSRVVTSGSLYTFVVRGLGAFAGLMCAVAMLLAYAFASGYALTNAGLTARSLAAQDMGVTGPFELGDVLVVVAIGLGCGLLLIRRVSTFTATTLVIQIVTVASVLVLVVAVLAAGPGLAEPFSLEGADPLRIAGGASIVLAMLVGFECSASHGAEASRPFRSVPRAMTSSLLLTGALSLLTTLVLTADPAAMLDALHQSVRMEAIWFPEGGATVTTLFRVVRILSLIACILAIWAAMTRLVFTLALEGALPPALRRTHDRHHSPYLAVLWTSPLVIAPGAFLVAADHPRQTVLASLLDTSGLVMLVAYLLVCLAVPVFLHRLNEVSAPALIASALGVVVVLGAMACNIWLQGERGDTAMVAVVALVVVPVAIGWYRALLRRRPAALRRMGVHDQSIAADAWSAS